jgi:hypothetical protein
MLEKADGAGSQMQAPKAQKPVDIDNKVYNQYQIYYIL